MRAIATALRSTTLKAAQKPMMILGRGALRAPDGAAVLAAAWQMAARYRRAAAGLARLQPAAPVRRPGRRAGPRLRAGQAAGRRCWRAASTRCGCWARMASSPSRIAPSHLRDLPGPPRRCDGGAGRRDPARRRLYREGRDLGEHRGARAARAPRDLPARRGAGGLAHHPRLQRGCGQALPYDDTNAIRARLAEASPVFARVGDVVARWLRRPDRAGGRRAEPMRPSCCRSPSTTRRT